MCNELSINLLPLYVSSLATNKKIKKDIEKLYLKHKYKAYQLAQNSPFYNHYFFVSGSIEREIYCKRILGLLLLSNEDEEVAKKLENIIIKGYRHLYNYIKKFKSKGEIKLSKCFEEMYKLNLLNSQMDIEVYNAQIIVMYIFIKTLEIEIDTKDKDFKYMYEFFFKLQAVADRENSVSYEKLTDEDRKIADKLINRLADYMKVNKFNIVDRYIDLMLNIDELKPFGDFVLKIIESEDVDINILANEINLRPEDLKILTYMYYYTFRNQNKEELSKAIFIGLLFKLILREYKKAKQFYFKNNKETLYLDLESLENKVKELKNKNGDLLKENIKLKKEIDKLKGEYKKSIEKENAKLKKEIERLKLKLKEKEDNEIELHKLREFIFEKENKDVIDFNENAEVNIPNLKILIVGGHPNWQEKLKKLLPNKYVFLNGFKENFDIKLLENIEHVFFYTDYMNHATYYRVINYCKKNNIPFGYLNSTNPEYVKKDITNKLTESF